jgi:hypothetical protein
MWKMDIYSYELIVKGLVNKNRFLNFDDLKIDITDNNNTKMNLMVDQSSLHAVLKTIRDLKLIIISLKLLNQGGIDK